MANRVKITGVGYGKNNNHLKFKGSLYWNQRSSECSFDFIGTEVSCNVYIPEAEKRQLLSQLLEDYGYAPYDIKKAQEVLGEGKTYMID